MTLPKHIIELAIEGGWDIKKGVGIPAKIDIIPSMQLYASKVVPEKVILDPLFWEALGKRLGWSPKNSWKDSGDIRHAGWIIEAKRFYDIILTNGNTDKFWEELLESN